jgi:hypothetical protein
MNKPAPNPLPADDGPGPVDENGQQIWPAQEAEAIARLHRDPAYWAAIEQAEDDIRAGRVFTAEEVAAHSVERRRRFLAERNR